MRIKSLLLCLLINVFLLMCSYEVKGVEKCGDEYSPAEKVVFDHLENIKNKNKYYLYSEYKYYDKVLSETVIVSLIIEFGKTNGMMIEKNNCTVTNLSTIAYSEENFALIVEDTHGGVASYEEARGKLHKFLKKKFSLLTPQELINKLKVRPLKKDKT